MLDLKIKAHSNAIMGWYTKNKVNHHLLRLPEDTYADDEPRPRLVELTVD